MQADFEQALGEVFAEAICLPVPFEEASAHECVEAIAGVMGNGLRPERFVGLGDEAIEALGQGFAAWFEGETPSAEQLRSAVARLLRRWPAR